MYYKVISVHEHRIYSSSRAILPSELIVHYVVGEFVSSVNPLFVFNKKSQINNTINTINTFHLGIELWSCEVVEARPHPTMCNISFRGGKDARWFYDQDHIKRYWAGSIENSIASPAGTYICDFVKLVERVM